MTYSSNQARTKNHGCSIRETLEALIQFGAPPEVYRSYLPATEKTIPTDRHLFSFVGDFLGLRIARLDSPDSRGRATLKRIKKCLRLKIPIVFGYEVHHLMTFTLPFPLSKPFYSPGWQTVVACGFDDDRKCLHVRNSWGKEWAENGYGWLPYSYVLNNHSADFWILWKDEWLEHMCLEENVESTAIVWSEG